MTENIVQWFEIYVQQMPRAREFYERVFAVKLEHIESPEIEMWAFPMLPDRPGASGALVKMEGVESGGSSVIVYFESEDCAVDAERVVKAGGKLQKPKFAIGKYGFISLVRDTEGNLFGLHSRI